MVAPVSAFEPKQIDQTEGKPSDESSRPGADEYIYLMGRPTLRLYLHFMKHQAVNDGLFDPGAAADEWRAAHDHIRTLQKEEAGLADFPPIGKLDSRLEPLRDELLKDPLIVNGFNTVPTNFALVELDRLVVYQKHIDLTYVRHLKERLGPAPSEEEIFRVCLPVGPHGPPTKWSRAHQNTYVFVSPSNDLRFLGVMPLQPRHIADYPPPGALAGVIGLAVGFGSNFLNAIYAENRLILNNGSHRAFALRELGVTHAPCIVQLVTSRDELDAVGSARVRENPDQYLRHPRPSMLKDYFNPRLRKVVPVHRRLRQVTVKFEVNEVYVPAL